MSHNEDEANEIRKVIEEALKGEKNILIFTAGCPGTRSKECQGTVHTTRQLTNKNTYVCFVKSGIMSILEDILEDFPSDFSPLCEEIASLIPFKKPGDDHICGYT